MKSFKTFGFLILVSTFMLSGCVVRTYQTTRERADQDLTSGNRGYLKGHPASETTSPRKTTRTTQVTEIELYSPVRFDKAPQKVSRTAEPKNEPVELKTEEDKELWGNRGYISSSVSPQIAQPKEGAAFEKYTIQKNDTLQKISQKFYGTSKKWNKIFEANKTVLKSPNKIHPGKVINIPIESGSKTKPAALKEPKENLK